MIALFGECLGEAIADIHDKYGEGVCGSGRCARERTARTAQGDQRIGSRRFELTYAADEQRERQDDP